MQNRLYSQVRAHNSVYSSNSCGGNVDLSTREVLILAIMCGFAAFNLHSADTKSLFNVFTLVPAILFTFKILVMNKDNSTLSVGIVAMFWMYYGVGVVCDVIFGTGEGYLAVQLILVGALGISSYRGGLFDDNYSDKCSNISDPLSRLSNIVERKKSIEKCAAYSSLYRETVGTPTYSDFLPKLSATQSTLNLSSRTALQFDKDTAERTLMTAILKETDTALEIFPSEVEGEVSSMLQHVSLPESCDNSVLIHYGDLLADPKKTLQFSNHSDIQKITITNISGRSINWVVKTNAIYEIGASPSQGMLRNGAKTEINVVLNADKVAIPDAVRYSDKLAIDYTFVDDTKAKHKRKRMKQNMTKRYQFDILYRF
ncbi:hypothetical protein RB195_006989 [Necator americanus]|uniref:Major sperm protein n=1 Tax=Necator americanus TaxID=51031 RepID=A0ABR1BYZ6_NECAM